MIDKYKQIGEILQAARKEQKRPLSDVTGATRIMLKHLESVEAGNPGDLPSNAYFMLFARNYAQFLGLDSTILDEIANGGLSEPKQDDDPDPETKAEQAESISQAQSSRFLKSLITIVVIAILLFAAILTYDRFFVKPSDSTSLEIPDLDTLITNAPDEVRLDTDSGQLIVPDYVPPAPLTLQLIVKQDVWAFISRDGEKIVDRELKTGEVYNWEAKHRFRFSLGISTAIEMIVNGKKLAPLTETPRVISALEINQVNYTDYYPEPSDEISVVEAIEKNKSDSSTGGSNGN